MPIKIDEKDHLFIPVNRFGKLLTNSRHNVKMYNSKKHMERYCRYDDGSSPVFDDIAHRGYSYYVEYVPNVHAKAVKFEDTYICGKCGALQPNAKRYVESVFRNSKYVRTVLPFSCHKCHAVLDFDENGSD